MIQCGEERPKEFVAVSTLTHVILHEGLYRILISITVILVVFWIWNYVTNVYTTVFVSAGLVLAVGAYLLKERESDD